MHKIFLALFVVLVVPTPSLGNVEMGIGMNSGHSGRIVPSITLGVGGKNWIISGFSSGVRNSYYYHANYGLHWFRTFEVGKLLGTEVTFGVGAGAMYAEREFQDLGVPGERKSDFVLGPAFRVNWTFLKIMFLNVDATYGLRNIYSHLFLNFQDVISVSVGVRY